MKLQHINLIKEDSEDIIPLAAEATKLNIYDDMIKSKAIGAYNLHGDYLQKLKNNTKWINFIKNLIMEQQNIIANILNNSGHGNFKIQQIVSDFVDSQNLAFEIKDEIGYNGDWQDIIIAAQRHPIHTKLLKIRENLKEYLDQTNKTNELIDKSPH